MGIYELAQEYSPRIIVIGHGCSNSDGEPIDSAYLDVSFPAAFMQDYLSIAGGSLESLVESSRESSRFWSGTRLVEILGGNHSGNMVPTRKEVLDFLKDKEVCMKLVTRENGVVIVRIEGDSKPNG